MTARAGNVIGGGDMSPSRLLPDFFRAFNLNSNVKIHAQRQCGHGNMCSIRYGAT